MTTEEKQAWMHGLQVGDPVCIGPTNSRTWRVVKITRTQVHVGINEHWNRVFRKSDGREVGASASSWDKYCYLHSIEEVKENQRREYERLPLEGKKRRIMQNIEFRAESLSLDELEQALAFMGDLIANRAKTGDTDNA